MAVDSDGADIDFNCEDFQAAAGVEPVASGASIFDFLADKDDDGLFDCCDSVVFSNPSVAGGQRATMLRNVRNVCSDGSPDFPNGCPDFGASPMVTVGGDDAANEAADLLQLLFDLPNQELSSTVAPNEGALSVDVMVGASTLTATTPVASTRMAYVGTADPGGGSGLTEPGQFRVVDLDASPEPDFVDFFGTEFFPVASGGLAPIPGTPVDIEIRMGAVDEYAYVTSVEDPSAGAFGASTMSDSEIIPLPGGGGGGGGCSDRKTMLSVLAMDRANGFGSAQIIQTIQLSCVDPATRPPGVIEEIGLTWNLAHDKLYVVVPDADSVKVFPRLPDSTLDAMAVEVIPTTIRPTDIVMATFQVGGGFGERAVVTSLGNADMDTFELPGIFHFATSDAGAGSFIDLGSDARPVSVSAHPALDPQSRPVVIVADEARQEIKAVDIDLRQVVWTIPATTVPKRVTTQGQ